MKKISLLLLLTLSSSLALAGCGEQGVVNTPVSSTPSTATTNSSINIEKTPSQNDEQAADSSKLAPFFQTDEVTYNKAKLLDANTILAPHKAAMQTILEKQFQELNQQNSGTQNTEASWNEVTGKYRFYDIGTINKAPYKGWKLLLLDLACDGPCYADNTIRFAWDPNARKLVELEKLSSILFTPQEFEPLSTDSDSDFEIKGMVPPSVILLNDGVKSVSLLTRDSDFYAEHDNDGNAQTPDVLGYGYVHPDKVAFTDKNLGNVYFDGGLTGNLLVKFPDGTVSTYAYNPQILDAKNNTRIIWNDKSEPGWIADNYSLMQHGCGVDSYYIENVKSEYLMPTGKTPDGTVIYEAKNKTRLTETQQLDASWPDLAQVELNDVYSNYAGMWDDQYYAAEHPKSSMLKFEDVVAAHPLLYWQDPFGRYVALIKNDFKPSAECGKPVIYLYPEKTADVSVKVNVPEFTKTEPAYGNGWKVKASPDGQIYNYADGKTYPYLFWEGKKDGGMNVSRGTVIAKADVGNFLNDSLSKLGLNEKESKEFKDFWLPKMQAVKQPYIFVSFAGTTEFNKVAPLDIQPAPQTLIRVFMYYMPLNQKVEVAPQRLTSVVRKGFTVVEWGGTSSDGWQTK